jgi:hypothetical protein
MRFCTEYSAINSLACLCKSKHLRLYQCVFTGKEKSQDFKNALQKRIAKTHCKDALQKHTTKCTAKCTAKRTAKRTAKTHYKNVIQNGQQKRTVKLEVCLGLRFGNYHLGVQHNGT